MPTIIKSPARIEAAGNKPKIIEEFIGRVNSDTADISVAKMKSPEGWIEPGQTPEFDEYTIVLKGSIKVETKTESYEIKEGQAIIAHKGEWVRYSSPSPGGAEYIAICSPAFSPDTVNRDK
ncbi:MAG: cupin [Ignavibacteria bacterium]|jgi:mannose-6-phosphate isomerase-like protein (cupin superfamily)